MSLTTSYNGWPASPDRTVIGVQQLTYNNMAFPNGVVSGDVATIFAWLIEYLDLNVEKVHDGWCWGYNYRANVNNPSTLSCHASGTAIDYNAPAHPNGKAGTFSAVQVEKIRQALGYLEGTVKWGGDFRVTKDEMHFEISANPDKVHTVANKIILAKKPPVIVKVIKKLVTPKPKPATHDGVVRLANIHRGAHNEDVREVQRVLNRWYPRLDLAEDGIFGARTLRALVTVRRNARIGGSLDTPKVRARVLRQLGFKVI